MPPHTPFLRRPTFARVVSQPTRVVLGCPAGGMGSSGSVPFGQAHQRVSLFGIGIVIMGHRLYERPGPLRGRGIRGDDKESTLGHHPPAAADTADVAPDVRLALGVRSGDLGGYHASLSLRRGAPLWMERRRTIGHGRYSRG